MALPHSDSGAGIGAPFSLPIDDVEALLRTDAGGLTSDDAAARLGEHGRNELPEAARTPAWRRFLSHFNDILIYILLASAAIKAVMGDWLEFWVIIAVAVINAVIGFVQEGRAEKALAGIRGMLSREATVRRDGAWITATVFASRPATGCRPTCA